MRDVGDFDVRTRSKDYYDLIVHDGDEGDRFIFPHRGEW